MNDIGWIKLYRKITNESWYTRPSISHLAIHLVLMATVTSHNILFNKQELTINRGQLITTLRQLTQETGLTCRQIRTGLDVLSNTHFLTSKTTNKFTLITLCNYDRYQDNNFTNDKQNDKQKTNERQTKTSKPLPVNQFQTPKNEKNEKNIKDPDFYLSKIENLKKRYSDPDIIDRILDAVRTTRKTGRIADSVIYELLQKLGKYPVQQVQVGCQIYLDKSYHFQGKNEKYLLGIVRKQSEKPDQTEQAKQSSGSPLLDAYYSGKLNIKPVEV